MQGLDDKNLIIQFCKDQLPKNYKLHNYFENKKSICIQFSAPINTQLGTINNLILFQIRKDKQNNIFCNAFLQQEGTQTSFTKKFNDYYFGVHPKEEESENL